MAFQGTFTPGSAVSSLNSDVEISVSCKNLKDEDLVSKSDPTCVLFIRKAGIWTEFGRTEKLVDSLNPSWTAKFLVKYCFEEKQMLKFGIYDIDSTREKLKDHDPLGSLECSLGEIMAQQSKGFTKELSKGKGTISLHAEEVCTNNDLVTLKFTAEGLDNKDLFGKSDPFFEISRANESNDFSIVYRSEVISNDLNPKWKTLQISSRKLCNGDKDRTLKIDVFDYDNDGSHELIGSFKTNLRRLSNGPSDDNTYDCINQKKKDKKGSKYKNSGIVKLSEIKLDRIPSFLDYIQEGLQLNFTLAVDFTASNGNPSNPKSLHYKDPSGSPNQYVSAIQAVGDIVQDYDSDKMFPGLGFGARIPPRGDISHEFFLNLNPQSPFCAGIPGLVSAYYTSLNMVQLSGPTNFSPVINHVAKFAESYRTEPTNYFVLLIITDGIITDFEETMAAISRISSLPISIIIVGVGDEDFSAMEALDGEDIKVGDNDIVQFVEMRKFKCPNGWNKESLARAVLAEVPAQVCNWMKTNGFASKKS